MAAWSASWRPGPMSCPGQSGSSSAPMAAMVGSASAGAIGWTAGVAEAWALQATGRRSVSRAMAARTDVRSGPSMKASNSCRQVANRSAARSSRTRKVRATSADIGRPRMSEKVISSFSVPYSLGSRV